MSSSQQSDSSTPKNKKQKPRKPIPVMDLCMKIKPKHKEIVINLSMTKYDVIADVAEQLDWHIQYSSKKGDWDVIWVDHMVQPETLIKLHFFQKISHFPGIHVLARKNLLGLSLMEMKRKFGQDYSFFPETWMLPQDYGAFRQEVEKGQIQGEKKCFIVKPEADCQGRGIFLTFKTDQVQNGKHYVVQEYIPRPFLVEGLKFDFRVYVLLCGTNPMRLYVYEQGLARFATEKYQNPNQSNLSKMFMHLTNYAINKKNPKYIYNKSSQNMATGHKRSLTSVFENMKRRGFNIQSLKKKIDDVLIKTILLGTPLVSHQYKFCQPDDDYRCMCFHILGIDVMIDQLLNPIVLQVNHTPSFATDTPLDYFIKFNLIKDTLVLMNINEKSKKQLIKKTNNYRRERVTNAKRLLETQEQKQKIKECQEKRDAYQNNNMGRYRKVYPVEDEQMMQKYEEYYIYAEKIYFSENNWIRAELEAERQKYKQKEKQKQKDKVRVNSSFKQEKAKQSSQLLRISKHNKSYSEKTKVQNTYLTRKLSPSSFRTQLKSSLLGIPLQAYSACFDYKTSSQDISSSFPSPTKLKHASYSQVQLNNEEHKEKAQDNIILPKIQQITNSPIKPFTTGIRKNKYQSLKKRMNGTRDFSPLKKIECSLNQDIFCDGKYLRPKVVKFSQQFGKLQFQEK